MREPLPIISAPGAIFGMFIVLSLYLIKGQIPNPYDNGNFYLGIGAIALIIGPFFNVIFHPVWKMFFNGFQSFGLQKHYLKKGIVRERIGEVFDKEFYREKQKNNKLLIYIEKRKSAFLLHIHSLWALIISFLIFIVAVIYSLVQHTLKPTMTIILFLVVSLFAVFFCLLWKRFLNYLDTQIENSERQLLQGRLSVIERKFGLDDY